MGVRSLKISKHIPSSLQSHLNFSSSRFSLSVEHPYEQYFVRTLLITLAAVLMLYVYFVSSSVLNVVSRKEAMAQSVKLQSLISLSEQKFFALSQSVTPDKAMALGLSPVADPQYVHRSGNAVAATIARNEI